MEPHHKSTNQQVYSFRPAFGAGIGDGNDLNDNDMSQTIHKQKIDSRNPCTLEINQYRGNDQQLFKSLGLTKAELYQHEVLGTHVQQLKRSPTEKFSSPLRVQGPRKQISRGPGSMVDHMCGQQQVDMVKKGSGRQIESMESGGEQIQSAQTNMYTSESRTDGTNRSKLEKQAQISARTEPTYAKKDSVDRIRRGSQQQMMERHLSGQIMQLISAVRGISGYGDDVAMLHSWYVYMTMSPRFAKMPLASSPAVAAVIKEVRLNILSNTDAHADLMKAKKLIWNIMFATTDEIKHSKMSKL